MAKAKAKKKPQIYIDIEREEAGLPPDNSNEAILRRSFEYVEHTHYCTKCERTSARFTKICPACDGVMETITCPVCEYFREYCKCATEKESKPMNERCETILTLIKGGTERCDGLALEGTDHCVFCTAPLMTEGMSPEAVKIFKELVGYFDGTEKEENLLEAQHDAIRFADPVKYPPCPECGDPPQVS